MTGQAVASNPSAGSIATAITIAGRAYSFSRSCWYVQAATVGPVAADTLPAASTAAELETDTITDNNSVAVTIPSINSLDTPFQD